VIGQNKLFCDWSAWIRLGVEESPQKGRLSSFVWVPSWALKRAADRLVGCPHSTIHPNIVWVVRLRGIRCEGHVARMGESGGIYRVIVRKPEGKRKITWKTQA